ncbi:myosin heavy chain, cardiac muscle isoform-like [Tripterygium wilfordii]|uniref:myosin heavy chain, cardiac muscle isoform-like n=1 Tax=Tripterygium wilfordii TaxID=458696 RepID=UPI0018F8330B|nr:myosin heavy chain, cardiac muscle isoform-like [Tripterygium wilfordii]
MFRLQKTRPSKSGEKVDFKLSHFRALQVPKGWERLYVNIISVETGKTIGKLSKALVRNGNCRWTETLLESIWVPGDDSSKELEEECIFKLVVAMGSARSGILGEATVNMASYACSSDPVPLQFPLKKCSHGTVLQVKIHCLTPRTDREITSKETNSNEEDLNPDSPNVDVQSEASNSVSMRSASSNSGKDLVGEPRSMEESFSATSGSYHSYDSAPNSMEMESFSSSNNLNGDEHNLKGAQEPTRSFQNSAQPSNSHAGNPFQSKHSSFNSQHMDSNHQYLRTFGSSKNLLEAAEDTIEELRSEAKTWERNARKLMLELEIMKKEHSDQYKNQANLRMELSAACAEHDGLQKEVARLKQQLEKSMVNPSSSEVSVFQDEGVNHVKKELQDEIKFQKESNNDLALQLMRSQESNLELVCVLQELEETIEKQKLEIETLSTLQLRLSEMDSSILESTEEDKRGLMLQLQQFQEEESLPAKGQQLEKALQEIKIDNVNLTSQALLVMGTEYKTKLFAKEEEIASLRVKLSEFRKERRPAKMDTIIAENADLIGEIKALKEKLQMLERDSTELTDEKFQLLSKLKEKNDNAMAESTSRSSNKLLANGFIKSRSEVSDEESEMHILKEKLKKEVLDEIGNEYNLSIKELERLNIELEVKIEEHGEELAEKSSKLQTLEVNLASKEEEISKLLQSHSALEAKFSDLQDDKAELEDNMEDFLRESEIATKCLTDLQNDLIVLSSSVDSHISVNKYLEKQISELETGKQDLEIRISDLEQENVQLSALKSDLDAQLRSLTVEKDASELELEKSKHLILTLQDEITKLRNDMETQKMDLKQNLEDTSNQLSAAKEECKCLRTENTKLQAATESLIDERNLLKKTNGDLKKQNLELHELHSHLQTKLKESHASFTDSSKKIKLLEEKLSSVLEDNDSRGKILTAELDALLDENRIHKEKLDQGEMLLNQMYMEHTAEVESLQQEVKHLARKLSAAHDERDRITSECEQEVSHLRATLESDLNNMQLESEEKVQGLVAEVATFKQNMEKLKTDNDRLLKSLQKYKHGDDKFKTAVNDLELKLTVCEYERQQLLEESSNLKMQLLKVAHHEDKVLTFTKKLNASKSEKDKLEAALNQISGECEELKLEKNSLVDKISTLQEAVAELEDCKKSRITLEEKLLEMADDLAATETFCAQDAKLKNELSLIKRENDKFQQKIQLLEEEKFESIAKAQALEEELKLMKEEANNQRASNIASYRNRHQRESKDGYEISGEIPYPSGDALLKIRSLEEELAKATEANKMYKVQLKRLTSEGRKNRTEFPRKLTTEGEVTPKDRNERTNSSMEAELRDLRDRYLTMSLKYAEVEAEREELVMNIKAAKEGKRLFSFTS